MFQNLRQHLAASAIIGLLSLWASNATAQQAPATIRLLPEDVRREHNSYQHNFYFLPPGVTGENYENAGFFGQRLRPYLAGNEEALGYLNRYRRHKIIFLADRLVTIGALTVYGIKVFEKDKFPQYLSGEQKVAAGVFVAGILATVVINYNTNHFFQRSVEAHNAGKSSGALWPRLRPTGLGVGAVQGHPTLALSWSVR